MMPTAAPAMVRTAKVNNSIVAPRRVLAGDSGIDAVDNESPTFFVWRPLLSFCGEETTTTIATVSTARHSATARRRLAAARAATRVRARARRRRRWRRRRRRAAAAAAAPPRMRCGSAHILLDRSSSMYHAVRGERRAGATRVVHAYMYRYVSRTAVFEYVLDLASTGQYY
eukprot:COSAG01_NODE_1271_length_10961_cov_555.935739_8_plen_171_part_00